MKSIADVEKYEVNKKFVEALIEEFPELKAKKNQLRKFIKRYISDQLNQFDSEIDRLIVKSKFGNYKSMLKIIRVLTRSEDIVDTDEETGKSDDFLSENE